MITDIRSIVQRFNAHPISEPQVNITTRQCKEVIRACDKFLAQRMHPGERERQERYRESCKRGALVRNGAPAD